MTDKKSIRLKWLRVRAEYIHELAARGEGHAQIARTLSCDPGQVQLLSMTPLETLHPHVSDSAIATAARLEGERAGYLRALVSVEDWALGRTHRDLDKLADVLAELRSKLTDTGKGE